MHVLTYMCELEIINLELKQHIIKKIYIYRERERKKARRIVNFQISSILFM